MLIFLEVDAGVDINIMEVGIGPLSFAKAASPSTQHLEQQ